MCVWEGRVANWLRSFTHPHWSKCVSVFYSRWWQCMSQCVCVTSSWHHASHCLCQTHVCVCIYRNLLCMADVTKLVCVVHNVSVFTYIILYIYWCASICVCVVCVFFCLLACKVAIWVSGWEDLPHHLHTHAINTVTHTSSRTINSVISGLFLSSVQPGLNLKPKKEGKNEDSLMWAVLT